MFGLLGNGFEDPKSQAIMALAGGLLQGNFGGGLLGANQAFQQAKQDQARQGLLSMQMRNLQSEADERDAKVQQARRTQEWFGNLPVPTDPRLQQMHGAARAGALPLTEYFKATAPKGLEFGKIDPKDYTPESLRAAAATGDYTQLVPVRKVDWVEGQAVDSYSTAPGTRVAPRFDPNQPFNMVDGQVTPNMPFQQFSLNKANAGAPKVAVNTNDPTAVAQAGIKLQGEVRSAFKDDHVIANQYQAMLGAVNNPSAQGDTALLYSFFKVLDPASTVREGEIDMVKASRSIPDRFKGMAQKLANGQLLMPNERQDILTQAQRQVQARMPRSNQEVQAFRENAKRLGLEPSLYVPDPYAGINFARGGGGGAAQPDWAAAARAELARRGGQ